MVILYNRRVLRPIMDKTKVAVFTAIVMVIACFASLPAEADAVIAVQDGLGNSFVFDSPVEHVISIGVGPTATVIGVGALDKIAVADNYSYNNKDTLFDGLRERVDAGETLAGGNIYSSGKAQLKTDIIASSDPDTGTFDRGSDAVIVTGSDTYRNNIVPDLEELGFRYILQWYDITDYDGIVKFAETVSKVCTGKVSSAVDEMVFIPGYIEERVDGAGVEHSEAFYVTYSAGVFKVCNTGSLSASMIDAACGSVITRDSSRSEATYEASITSIVESHDGCIVFVDNTVHSNESLMQSLRDSVGGHATLVNLKQIWNNYCIESVDGVWCMACAMYPELFEGDIPVDEGGGTSDVVLYATAGIICAVAIAVVSAVYMRNRLKVAS